MYTYPRPQNLAYPVRVLSNEGPLSRSDPSADRAKAGRTGAPRNGRWPGGRWSAGRRCALPWARAVPCRARWVHHLPQGCPLVPWRLPSLHPLARFARDWQTSDALRRENEKAWLFETTKSEFIAKRCIIFSVVLANAGTHTPCRRCLAMPLVYLLERRAITTGARGYGSPACAGT